MRNAQVVFATFAFALALGSAANANPPQVRLVFVLQPKTSSHVKHSKATLADHKQGTHVKGEKKVRTYAQAYGLTDAVPAVPHLVKAYGY